MINSNVYLLRNCTASVVKKYSNLIALIYLVSAIMQNLHACINIVVGQLVFE